MPYKLFKNGLNILLRRQTNILSAAFVIMATVILSQILGLVRQRLLVSIFGASNTLGVYLAATRIPDLLFQLIIAGALSSAFIPVFSNFISRGEKEKGHKMASALLTTGMVIFAVLSLILLIFTPFFLQVFNLGAGFSPKDMELMAGLTRVIIFAQLIFIIGTFFSALLQSYNHFFIPGIAAASYNLGIVLGILFLSSSVKIYSPAMGSILGALIFIAVQFPMIRKIGFSFRFILSLKIGGVLEVIHLMWPRTISIAVFQISAIAILALISFLDSAGRNYVLFDYAQTLAFAPTVLIGQSIAQAAFPVLSREKDRLSEFKETFISSFNQMLYLILPISVLFLVLRVPIVRLIYGAGQFDWEATVLTGRTLAYFSLSIFSQALIYLVSRGFYALHDTKIPLIISSITAILMIFFGFIFIFYYKLGVESIAFAFSMSSLLNLILSMILLDRKTGGFEKIPFFISLFKTFFATFLMGLALYVPIKLLDRLVFDTTKTVNLILLTGISSFAGLSLYLFLTWFLNLKEAKAYILLFKKLGNWREILEKSDEAIDGARVKI